MSDWVDQNGPADLLGKHQTQHFSWGTAAELRASTARGLVLIQDGVVQQNPPRGTDANLVQALLHGALKPDGSGNRFPQMPFGGPFCPPEKVAVIAQWIDEGCQPDAPDAPPPAAADAC